MFNLFADTQKQMQDLLLETRSFVDLQKRVIIAETRDRLAVVLSRLAIAFVCLLLGGIILLFASLFLALVMGQALGNTAWGFACVTAIVLLLLVVFWLRRDQWVIQPINRLMSTVFTVEDETLSTEEVSAQLRESRERMSDSFGQLMHTGDRPANSVESVGNWVNRGFAVYEGLRLGLSIVRALGNLFGRRRRYRR